ncbi:MAG: DUF2934 domain-containing protein [Acidobacteriia bacterium]|nr:DUF2934 domain-containing protein [Terriglobia bacterium]
MHKVEGPGSKSAPVFEEIAKQIALVRQRAFDLFEKRGRELWHALEDWLRAEREVMGWPAAELAEKDGAYELHVTLPGFESKDLEVIEYGPNDVCRRFELPKPIEIEMVKARIGNGVLRIGAPLAAAVKSKQITVDAAA